MEVWTHVAAPFAASIVTLGAAFGISNIAKAAVKGMARQPEASSKIQTAMLIASALIEGVALFAAVICFMALLK